MALDGVIRAAASKKGQPLFLCLAGGLVRGKTAEDHRLLELLDPVAEAEDRAIVRLRLTGGDRARRLQIMAERQGSDGGLPVGDCARLSRRFAGVLDDADAIQGAYLLEVSSPGIDRPLTRLEDFDACRGLTAKLELERPLEGRKRFKGRLAGTDGGDVLVEIEDGGGPARLPFTQLAEAKLRDRRDPDGARGRAPGGAARGRRSK